VAGIAKEQAKTTKNSRKSPKNQGLTKILAASIGTSAGPSNFSEWFGAVAQGQGAATAALPLGGAGKGGLDSFHIFHEVKGCWLKGSVGA
jgi:hypothetical protein